MFIGHLGVGLAFKKLDRRLNTAWLMAAALFSDLLLWTLVLLGFERVHIPANFVESHFLTFDFPYSHSLVASLVWSILFYLVVTMLARNADHRRATIIAVAVFSHFLCDFVVHIPELPVLDNSSTKLGLGLWRHMELTLLLELGILVVGLILYLRSTCAATSAGKYGMILFMSVLAILAFVGTLSGPKPNSGSQVALSSLITQIIILILAYWLDTKRSGLKTEA